MQLKTSLKIPKLNNEWELLTLSDKTLLLNSIYGKQIHIKDNCNIILRFIKLCNGKNSIHDLQNIMQDSESDEIEMLNQLIAELKEHNVLIESRQPLADNLDDRFHTMLDVFEHFMPPELCDQSFAKLRSSHIVIIGAGGNGSFAAVMCASLGIKQVTIIDGDTVSESNLVRQIFYSEQHVKDKVYKVEALKDYISAYSRYTHVVTSNRNIDQESDIYPFLKDSDFVLLCADSPRFIINKWVNQACLKYNVPNLNAFAGLIGPLSNGDKSPCFECLADEYRKSFGELYDEIVVALQHERSRQYPSIVFGPMITAYHQMKEMIAFLTGIWPVRTLDGYLRLEDDQVIHQVIKRTNACATCGYYK